MQLTHGLLLWLLAKWISRFGTSVNLFGFRFRFMVELILMIKWILREYIFVLQLRNALLLLRLAKWIGSLLSDYFFFFFLLRKMNFFFWKYVNDPQLVRWRSIADQPNPTILGIRLCCCCCKHAHLKKFEQIWIVVCHVEFNFI